MQGSFPPAIPEDENRIIVPMILTVVAVDRDKNSQSALKWSVDNIINTHHSVTLVHVRCRQNGSGVIAHGEEQAELEGLQLLVPFRVFCVRRGIQIKEVILEDNDVSKALIDYITSNHIHNIVLGAAKSSLAKKFRHNDVPSGIVKSAPEFCGVYVISKGKVVTARLAKGPGAIPPRQPAPNHMHPSDDDTIKTPFGRMNRTPPMPPYGTPERKSGGSIDYTNQSARSSTSHDSLLDDMMDFHGGSGRGSIDFADCGEAANLIDGTESPSTPNGDMEAEMKRLKLELKQTMDMYSSACKEAITAKRKAKELHQSKMEEERKLEEARLAEEAAVAMAEFEKAKCKAAIEAAEAAQRIAELEARKRMNAERKMRREAEEKQKALDVLHQNDVRYRKYTIEEIELATENFSSALKIGEGGYGPVYGAALDHTPVAIKVLRPDAAQGRKQFQQEVEVLCCMRHPNMVLLLGACPEYGCLVYEYMDNGSLEDRIFRRHNSPPIPWPVRFKVAAEIATALLFLHQAKPEPLVHRDLKPANILLDRNYTSKIADVGLSRLVPPSVANQVTQYRLTSTAGTFCYIDPEYQSTGMLGIKSDIFSLGVVLLQIITAKPPMALAHHVGRSIEMGTFEEWLDPAVEDWPVEEALRFARLALKCAEMRRKDRPDLGTVVLPELNRLRNIGHAYEAGYSVNSGGSGSGRSSFSSEVPTPIATIAREQVNHERGETMNHNTAPGASEPDSTKQENESIEELHGTKQENESTDELHGTKQDNEIIEEKTTEKLDETPREKLGESIKEQVVESTMEQLVEPITEQSVESEQQTNDDDSISCRLSSNSSNATPQSEQALDQVNHNTFETSNPNSEVECVDIIQCTKLENESTEEAEKVHTNELESERTYEARLSEQLPESMIIKQSYNNDNTLSSIMSNLSNITLTDSSVNSSNTTPRSESTVHSTTSTPRSQFAGDEVFLGQLCVKGLEQQTSTRINHQDMEGMYLKFQITKPENEITEWSGSPEKSAESMTKPNTSTKSRNSFSGIPACSNSSIPRSKSNLSSLMSGSNKDSPRKLRRKPIIPTCKPTFL